MFKIDYSTEVAVMSLFTDSRLKEFTKYCGLDPALAREHQPVDPEEHMHECIAVTERHQGRCILQKTVTLTLDVNHFLCADDYRVFLPYGPVPSLTTFTYRESDETVTDLSAADFELSSEYPAFLWSDTWSTIFADPDYDYPEQVTLSWTSGYSALADVPRSTWQAIKILGRFLIDSRGDERPIPEAYKAYAAHDAIEDHRTKRYLT